MSDSPASVASDTAFAAGTDVILSAQEHAAAQEVARAADSAALLAKVDEHLQKTNQDNKEDMKRVMLDVLGNVFGKEESTYIVKNRVPLLCQSVVSIKSDITEIKEMIQDVMDKFVSHKEYDPFRSVVVWIIMGVSSIVGVAILGGLLSLILK